MIYFYKFGSKARGQMVWELEIVAVEGRNEKK